MMSASEVTLLIVVGVLLVLCVAIAVLFSQALQKALNHADTVHDRAWQQLQVVMDRFMALDFAVFKSYQMASEAPTCAQSLPPPETWGEDRPYAEVTRPDRSGFGGSVGLRSLIGDGGPPWEEDEESENE